MEKSSSSRKIEKSEPPFKLLMSIAAIHYQEYLCGEGKKDEKRGKKGLFLSVPCIIPPIDPDYRQLVLPSQFSCSNRIFLLCPSGICGETICLCPSRLLQPLPGPVPCFSTTCSASFPLKFISCAVAENVFWSPAVAHHCPAIMLHEYFFSEPITQTLDLPFSCWSNGSCLSLVAAS